MKYKSIKIGEFVDRPNRFISHVAIDGEIETVHVKNTGRCREILENGVRAILEKAENPNRKTKYSLVAAYKENKTLINIDSQITNKVIYEALDENKVEELQDLDYVKREAKKGNSRFDLYYEKGNSKGYVEIKSVTLEKDGMSMFPDAPTERGRKHVYELIDLLDEGYENYILFLIQIEDIKKFTPNVEMDPKFSEALKIAKDKGVNILAYNCIVKEDELIINDKVEVLM
ncbi:DNA/RNA nuclease SfsA [Anaeromicrobium sediminis]|uniref:Sugar fermentation stimulation protein homolog n=1 Tax=Anaeromicrobium sediminis TaxID=1478221 RepID=A0A267MNA2_9FIRM|nr:DNA/RNA nuclease SfsA [Anaeromicrobium sediminis]PAB61059.1 DNA/RNA nuclease SfsA [Anaeromicrobium sediminis]